MLSWNDNKMNLDAINPDVHICILTKILEINNVLMN